MVVDEAAAGFPDRHHLNHDRDAVRVHDFGSIKAGEVGSDRVKYAARFARPDENVFRAVVEPQIRQRGFGARLGLALVEFAGLRARMKAGDDRLRRFHGELGRGCAFAALHIPDVVAAHDDQRDGGQGCGQGEQLHPVLNLHTRPLSFVALATYRFHFRRRRMEDKLSFDPYGHVFAALRSQDLIL